jgi:hypothetical protein
MTDDELTGRLEAWMAQRGAVQPADVEAVAGHIHRLPGRGRRLGWSAAAIAAALVVAIGVGALALGNRLATATGTPAVSAGAAIPPDPAAFAGDARLARCGATVTSAIAAFPMDQARDYRRHLPAMGLSPELDVDDPAFVVVYRGGHPFGPGGGGASVGAPTAVPSASRDGELHDVCVLVGADPATAVLNAYSNVDTTGLSATVEPTASHVSPDASDPPTPSTLILPTLEPAPAWAGDARVQLACDGAPADLAGQATPDPDSVASETADAAAARIVERAWVHPLPIPQVTFEPSIVDATARLYVYRVGGRTRAAIAVVRRDADRQWYASSVAACPETEFDPTVATGTGPIGRWSDAAGRSVPPAVLAATPDCYGGTQVTFNRRLFVRIPGGGVDEAQLEIAWAADVPLPKSAIATLYRSGNRRLYRAADGRAIYIATGSRAERLPHVRGDEVLRTDCN